MRACSRKTSSQIYCELARKKLASSSLSPQTRVCSRKIVVLKMDWGWDSPCCVQSKGERREAHVFQHFCFFFVSCCCFLFVLPHVMSSCSMECKIHAHIFQHCCLFFVSCCCFLFVLAPACLHYILQDISSHFSIFFPHHLLK